MSGVLVSGVLEREGGVNEWSVGEGGGVNDVCTLMYKCGRLPRNN